MLMLLVCVQLLEAVIAAPYNMTASSSENEVSTYDFPFVTRAEWKAREPKEVTPLSTPVPYVVIHHSYEPKACYSGEECRKAMRSMQNFHMDDRGWWDIGYNFGVGSDGSAYEGRGWESVGAHALHFNTVSVGICVIGDWREKLPPPEQLKVVQGLIAAGVELGYIKKDYKLVGHRQVRATECPGKALFEEIKTWERYSEHPSSVDELVYVEELPESTKKLLKGK